MSHSSLIQAQQSFPIGNIHFEGIDPRDEKWLLSLSKLKENSEISLVQLEKAVSILMGTNAYSHVSYQLTGGAPYTLHLILQEKSDSSLNLGLRYDTEENLSLLLNATFDYRAKARSHFSLTGRLGKSSYARLDYALERSPLRNINVAYMFRYQDMDIYRRGEKTYNTTYQHHFAEIAFSDMTWLNFKVKAGIRYEYFNYNSFLYKEEYHDFKVKPEGFISYFGSAHLETLDSRYFPNRGVSLEAHYSMYTDNFVGYNGKSPFSSVQVGFISAIRIRSHLTLLPSLYGRVLIGGNLAYPYLNAVGGEAPQKYLPQQIPFAGINHIEIFDNSVGVARLQIRQRLWSRNYITVTGNYGIHHDDFLKILKGKHIWGAGIGYAYNSLAGPLSATLSISDWSKSVLFYLNLGYTF